MKNFIAWLLLVCLTASNAEAAIALVASDSDNGNTATAVTAGVDTTGADFMIICVGFYGTTTPAASDSNDNEYTALTRQSSTDNTSCSVIYYCAAPTVGASHTVTVSQANSYPSIVVYAFSGVTATSPADQQNGWDSDDTTFTSAQPGSITPSEDNCLLISAACMNQATAGFAINSSFATPVSVSWVSSNGTSVVGSYKIQTTAGAENPTWSWTGSQRVATTIASFKPAAGGSAVPVIFHNSQLHR